MNGKFLILGLTLSLLFFVGCISDQKEVIYLPAIDSNVEKSDFEQTLSISGEEQLDLSGTYAIITIDNVLTYEANHKASFSSGTLGSEITFLGSKWTLVVFDCSIKKVGLSGSKGALTLESGSKLPGGWKVLIGCSSNKLSSITLDASRKSSLTEGDSLCIPSSSKGYCVEYVGEGVFELVD